MLEITDTRRFGSISKKESYVQLQPQTTVRAPAHNNGNLKQIYHPWKEGK